MVKSNFLSCLYNSFIKVNKLGNPKSRRDGLIKNRMRIRFYQHESAFFIFQFCTENNMDIIFD